MAKHYLLLTLIALLLGCPQQADARARATGGNDVTVYDADRVDVLPEFPGGDRALLSFINSTRVYPEVARRQSLQGRVTCCFVVHPDGHLSHVNVVRGIHDTLDREAVRIIQAMPRWTPGMLNGSRVPVYCMLTIPFKL